MNSKKIRFSSAFSKLTLMLTLNFLLLIGIGIQYYLLSRKQKTATLVVNVAGRQRMLTQKITKGMLSYVREKKRSLQKETEKAALIKDETTKAVILFDKSLKILKNGGITFFVGEHSVRVVPPAPSLEIFAQLKKVDLLWYRFKSELFYVLRHRGANRERFSKAYEYVLNSNNELLDEVNNVVGLFEGESEKCIEQIKHFQFFSILAGIILFACILSFTNTDKNTKQEREKTNM